MKRFARLPHDVRLDGSLPPTAQLLFGDLDAAADKRVEPLQCTVTHRHLARTRACSIRTVIRHLNALEAAGYIRPVRSSGTRKGNTYLLLPDPPTRDTAVTGPGAVTGGGAPPYMSCQEQEKEGPSPPVAPPLKAPDTHLFAEQHRRDFPAAVDYWLGEMLARRPDPALAALRPWFPAFAAEAWLVCRWDVRTTDAEYAARSWAPPIARRGAAEADVLAAFDGARDRMLADAGKRTVRDEVLREVLAGLARRPPPAAAPAGSAEDLAAWAALPEAVRAELQAAARRELPLAGRAERAARCLELMRQRVRAGGGPDHTSVSAHTAPEAARP